MGKAVSCEVVGLDEMIKRLDEMGAKTDELLSKALYAGAKVMADGLKSAIQSLPQESGFKRFDEKHNDSPRNVVGGHDKEDLISHMGISRFQTKTGSVYARIGFDGYGQIKTKKYPNGRPVVLIARSINSGSSARMKHPFIKPTIAQYQGEATRAMQQVISEELKKMEAK